MKLGRNDPCSCGSGLKYKKCCLGKATTVERADPSTDENAAVVVDENATASESADAPVAGAPTGEVPRRPPARPRPQVAAKNLPPRRTRWT